MVSDGIVDERLLYREIDSEQRLDMSSSREPDESIVDWSTEMVSDGIVDGSLYWTTGVISDAIIMEA